MNENIDVSVVVPVYESAEVLSELVGRLITTFNATSRTYEIILVDDGSNDNSWQVISQLAAAQPDILTGIQLMRNYGQHNALMCGFRHVRGSIIVTLDDDLQNPPEEIHRLLEVLSENMSDVVYGLPKTRQDSRWRRVASLPIQYFIQKSIGLPGPVSAFRAIQRTVVDAILRYELNYTFIDGLIAWNTTRISFVTVEHHARSHGHSGYSIRKLFFHALNIATNFSILPLQIASATGLIAATSGLFLGVFYFLQSIFSNITVPGYASTIVTVFTLGGLQLLALGIIGEYIGRVHLNINCKPQYTVRKQTPQTKTLDSQ